MTSHYTEGNVSLTTARIAIVHEWLVTPGGSELILKEVIKIFPDADVFCLVDKLSEADRQDLGVGHPRTSFLQHIPGIARHYRSALPLMPAAVEALDLQAYDLVISNSHAVAKGVKTRPDALHICNCCSPMRYAWDLREQYLAEAGLGSGAKGWAANQLLDRLQKWDLQTSVRVTQFIAISAFIADRIQRAYGRSSTVLYPPVDTTYFDIGEAPRGNTYVAASRLVSYKRIATIVEAFRALPDRQLTVVGDGPERDRVAACSGANVTLMGWQPRDVMREQLRSARAFIFAAEEDFGILPVEAQACGAPVIALGVGGALETVIADGPMRTGVLFKDPTPAGIAAAVQQFESEPPPTGAACRTNAERFSVQRFHHEFLHSVTHLWSEHVKRLHSNGVV